MRILGIIWLRDIVDKLKWKHRVETEEVEEALATGPRFRRLERGDVAGEDLYGAFGQSHAGRYLTVLFIYKTSREALIVSARDMTDRERRRYAR